jgi:hypothetical protein
VAGRRAVALLRPKSNLVRPEDFLLAPRLLAAPIAQGHESRSHQGRDGRCSNMLSPINLLVGTIR